MQKVLVTGGAGFIGSHTVVALHEAGYTPIIVDNFSNSSHQVLDRIQTITGVPLTHYAVDCNDREAFREVFQKEGKFFGVIHFAAHKAVGESVKIPLAYYQNNLGSLLVLLELMQEFEVKNLVFSSSCTVYGQPKDLPVTEQTPFQPANSPYGQTKAVCEKMLDDCANAALPIKCSSLRYFNPVGAHPSGLIGELPIGVPQNLVPFITQTAAGIREKLTVFGNDYNTPDGTCIRDFIHVVDLAEAHVMALRWIEAQPKDSFNEVFNIGSGSGSSILEAIEAFQSATGVKLNYSIGPRRAGDIEQIYAEVTKSTELLKWSTKLSLADALRDAWKWQLQLEKDAK